MMKFPIALFALVVSLLVVSCKKDSVPTPSKPTDETLLKAFFDKNATPAETFTLNAATGGVLTSSKGTQFDFPANALLDAAGQPVTGNVTVRVKEMFAAADMLLNDKPTGTADGKMLISFGEFKLDARQGEKVLKLRDTSRVKGQAIFKPQVAGIGREIPMWDGDSAVQQTNSGLDYNALQVTKTLYVKRGVAWNQLPQFAVGNTGTGKIDFPIDKLGQWRNCDALMSDPRPKTTLMCYFGSRFNVATGASYQGSEPTMIFFKPKNTPTLIKLYNVIQNPIAGKEGFYSYQNSMPVGMEGTFLAMSVIDGKYYAEMLENAIVPTPVGGAIFVSLTFNPIEKTEAAFLAMIQSLNTK